MPLPIRNEHGVGLLTSKRRGLSLLLWSCSKRYSPRIFTALYAVCGEMLVLFVWTVPCCAFVLQHQSFPQSRNSFKVGMKLEGLDPSHPSLFCVLTAAEVWMLLTFVCAPVVRLKITHSLLVSCSLTRTPSLCLADPRLQSKTPLWWLPRMLRLLGQRRLVGYETRRLVWEERTQVIVA